MSNPRPGDVWRKGDEFRLVASHIGEWIILRGFGGGDHHCHQSQWSEWSASAERVFPPVETPPSGETQLRSEIRELQSRDDAQNELRLALVEEILGGVSLSPRDEMLRQFLDEARVKLLGAARVLKEKRAARVIETPDGSGVQHGSE
jgi:hypothetical protein